MSDRTRVGIEFSGNATGAVTAGARAQAAIRGVRQEVTRSSPAVQNLERDLGHLNRGALAGSGIFQGLGRSVAFASAGFLGGFGLAAAVRGAVSELTDSVKAGAQVQAVLRSTGGVAGVTAQHVDQLAQAQLRKTGADDELIKRGEAVLLTFTKVRNVAGQGNDVFDQAIKVTQDLSVALGQDLNSSVIQVGKALQDPITGMTALRRVGVSLDEDTQKQIKTLVEHNNLLGAQKIILAELQREFGGTAEKVGDVAPWMRLKETVKNLSADAIRPLLPELDGLVARAQKWADHLEHDSAAQQQLKDDVKEGLDVIETFARDADNVAGALGGWKRTIETLLALKVVSKLNSWNTALQTLIGTEAAAGAAGAGEGLAGASSEAALLRLRLLALTKIGPIVIPVGLSYFFGKYGAKNAIQAAINPFKSLGPDIAPDVTGIAGNPYPKGSPAYDAWNRAHPNATSLTPSPVNDPFATANPTVSANLVRTAKSALGVPYQYGGLPSLSKPTDCSGLMVAVFAKNGITIPRTSQQQFAQAPIKNSKPLLPGDLVFSEGVHPGHVGMYIGGNQVLEDPHTGDHVKIVPLSAFGWNGESARWWGGVKPTGGSSGGGTKKGAAPPKSGTTPPPGSTVTLPTRIQQALSAASLAAARAASTPGKADDKAAVAQQRAAIEQEIAYLNGKLATKLGPKKRITLEDLLTGAYNDLAALDTGTAKKKAGGAGIGTVTSLRDTINAAIKSIPANADQVERAAESHLEKLRAALKVGMSAGDLAKARSGVKQWGAVIKDEISKQGKAAAAAADTAAKLWDRTWQSDVTKVLRDFQENVAGPQLQAFDDATDAHLKKLRSDLDDQLKTFDQATQQGLKDRASPEQTPEERALAEFQANRQANDELDRKKDILAQIADLQAQLAGTAPGASGTLIDIATGQRSGLPGSQQVSNAADIQKQILDLQKQYHDLELDDQEAALQKAADASRKAADDAAQQAQDAYQADRDAQRQALQDKESAAEDAYTRLRDGQRQALQDQLDDQAAALQNNLDDWNTWLTAKAKSYQAFLDWLAAHGLSTTGLTNPFDASAAPNGGGVIPFTRAGRVPFATGGKVPGIYVGRNDTIPAMLTPGEYVIPRQLTAALEQALLGGGGGAVKVVAGDIYMDGRKVGDHVARVSAYATHTEQARVIGYKSRRG